MLVLLKVATETPLPVPVAVPRTEMQVGQWTVAVGRALSAQEISLSVGILSALDRIWGRAIQTDAKVSPSNYGGPLVDLHGRVLGVLVPLAPEEQTEVAGAEWYDSGIGFAVPLVDLQQRLDVLRSGRDLTPGILGIGLRSRDLYAEETEIAVVEVKSPAAEAGLRAGDRIVRVDATEIQRGVQLKHALGPLYAGDTVELVVLRDGTEIETKATLVDQLLPYERPFLGILPQSSAEDGVPIRFVFPESGAAEAGLQPRDRIRTVAGKPVRDAAHLRTELANLQPQEEIRLDVERDGSFLSRKATLSGPPTEIPPQFPPGENLPEAAGGSFETGVIEVRIAEHANSCSAYVPEEYDGRRPYGLLVSLAPPGSEDPIEFLDPWKEVCARHDLILLTPQSQDAQRWMPTEVDFVRKTIDQILGRYRVDRSRVAVHGREGARRWPIWSASHSATQCAE